MNDGGPAFPCPETDFGTNRHGEKIGSDFQPGISTRDYFAAKAIQGCVGMVNADNISDLVAVAASAAYKVADAMLAEREKTQRGA